ncbi:MAG: cytochrome c3 family protein, partial [Candidatus Angelobacter sp.]
MAQIFHRSANTLARASILGVVLLLTGVGAALFQLQRSPYVTNQHMAPPQPIPFSHQHHVAGLGIDCRYCHTSVEESSFAGIPPTKTCMNCHAQMWTNTDMLAPVRYSFRTGQSIQWTRVHDLPDFVYFNHSIHVNKGVGCESCHGRVDRMPLTYQEPTLQMEWCLNCHRHPEEYVRPKQFVTTMGYEYPANRLE